MIRRPSQSNLSIPNPVDHDKGGCLARTNVPDFPRSWEGFQNCSYPGVFKGHCVLISWQHMMSGLTSDKKRRNPFLRQATIPFTFQLTIFIAQPPCWDLFYVTLSLIVLSGQRPQDDSIAKTGKKQTVIPLVLSWHVLILLFQTLIIILRKNRFR